MTGISGRRALALLASSALSALAANAAHAQDASPAIAEAPNGEGTITGRVYDAATGKSLHGAIVRVAGTSAQDYTTDDGRFRVVAPGGSATLEVEYVGLDKSSQTITVPAGGNVVANIGLTSKALSDEAIVVRAAATGQQLAINQQKTAMGIVNVVSEEVFGQMPDGNIGYAVQRLPGLSVDTDQSGEPTGINIRGIEADYNSFQIDGNRLPTTGGGRGFNTTTFAADGISTIEVIKAPTPDRDGDAIGGIVNVITRSAFERSGREIELQAGGVYSDLPDKWGHALTATYLDLLSVGGGDRNLGVSATVASYQTDRYSLNRDMDWVQVTPANNPELNLGQYDDPVWFMEASHWEYDTRVTQTTTANLGFDFRTDAFNSFYLRGFYSNAGQDGVKYETDIDIDTRFQDAVGGRKTYDELTPTSGRGTPGDDGSRGSRGWIGTADDRDTDLYSVNFGGKHEGTRSLLTYDLFYSRSKQKIRDDNELNFVMEPDDPWLRFEYQVLDVNRGEVIINQLDGGDPTDLSQVTEGELILNSSDRDEQVYSAKADYERSFDFGASVFTVKGGGKYYRSEAKLDQLSTVYSMDEAFPYAEVVVANDETLLGGKKYFDVIPANGVALLRSNPELFELEEEDSLEGSYFEDYDATEQTAAGYLMGTLRTGVHDPRRRALRARRLEEHQLPGQLPRRRAELHRSPAGRFLRLLAPRHPLPPRAHAQPDPARELQPQLRPPAARRADPGPLRQRGRRHRRRQPQPEARAVGQLRRPARILHRQRRALLGRAVLQGRGQLLVRPDLQLQRARRQRGADPRSRGPARIRSADERLERAELRHRDHRPPAPDLPAGRAARPQRRGQRDLLRQQGDLPQPRRRPRPAAPRLLRRAVHRHARMGVARLRYPRRLHLPRRLRRRPRRQHRERRVLRRRAAARRRGVVHAAQRAARLRQRDQPDQRAAGVLLGLPAVRRGREHLRPQVHPRSRIFVLKQGSIQMNTLSTRLRAALLAATLLVVPAAHAQDTGAQQQPAQAPAPQRAKNVILFLADAGGVSVLNAASLLGYGEPLKLHIQQWPHLGLSETSPVDQFVSDSANGMSSIVTGVKTRNGVISQAPAAVRGKQDGAPTKTLLEYAEQRGLRTAVVTTQSIADATPAANYAHSNDRGKWGEIFPQAFTPRFGDGVDVLFGAGRKKIGEQLAAAGTGFDQLTGQHNRPIYTTLAEVPASNQRPVVVGDTMDARAATLKALDLLQQSPTGYLLVVEWDAHTDDPREGLQHVVDFDKLVAEVEARVNLDDTLLLFTADHSFGLQVDGGKRGDDLLAGYDAWKASDSEAPIVRLENVLVNDTHTGEEVPALATGTGAERVRGYFPNTYLFKVMMDALGWQPDPAPAN